MTGIGDRLVAERRAAWERWYGPVAAAPLGERPVAHAGVGDLRRRVRRRGGCSSTLVLQRRREGAAGAGGGVSTLGLYRRDGRRDRIPARNLARRLHAPGLARGLRGRADRALPTRRCPSDCSREFASSTSRSLIPGPSGACSKMSACDSTPGSVVAIVGENGAGKTTLVKLLCRLYQPTSGRILVDGVDLARMPVDAWRSRLAGAFQDFFRFEFRASHTVGLGDLPRLDDEPAVATAVGRAGADDVVDRLVSGLETQLGPTWPGWRGGQLRPVAEARPGRGFMRDHPLLLVLDEPTAALDAETEHALFERFAAAARGGKSNGAAGGATAASRSWCRIASAPVRMADLIVVLDGARVVEVGATRSSWQKGGQYAELYGIQAAAYR